MVRLRRLLRGNGICITRNRIRRFGVTRKLHIKRIGCGPYYFLNVPTNLTRGKIK